jgi:hypothetical protein
MLVAALVTAVIAQAGAPVVETGVAGSVTAGGAVVAGTVDPKGAATTYQVEYGTTDAYGLTTPVQDAGVGTDPVAVSVPLTGLTASTTYHYRLVATNASGTTRGADRTLRTAAAPRPPAATTGAARSVTGDAATLAASVNPRGLATTVRFEYGTTTSYGTSTSAASAGSGTATRTFTQRITGLRQNTRYHVRVVATNAAGITRGADRTFTTARTPAGVTVTPSTLRPVWGSGLTLRGLVRGARPGGTGVVLERQDFPFTAPFREAGRATADSRGRFTLRVPPLFSTTRLRVATRTAVPVRSVVTTASVAVKVGLRTTRVDRVRVRLSGTIWPAVPSGRVSLQRRSIDGSRWVLVRRVTPRPLTGGRSRYAFTVRRGLRTRTYRVAVVARDGGAHVPGTSRSLRVRRR